MLAEAWTINVPGAIDATASAQGIDAGIAFLCAVVSQGSYDAVTPVG
jgi:hypothetical protein